tara:strand:- start:5689 stop:6036 length:348 start_codon:yes stop_codon:yes gene_type:complete
MGFSFQESVMIISVIILVLSLIVIGVALYRQKYADVQFPPVVADCPDYWTLDNTNGSTVCKNVQKLGSPQCHDDMNFSLPKWSGTGGLCAKSEWARNCELVWDGVTNNAKACQDN